MLAVIDNQFYFMKMMLLNIFHRAVVTKIVKHNLENSNKV